MNNVKAIVRVFPSAWEALEYDYDLRCAEYARTQIEDKDLPEEQTGYLSLHQRERVDNRRFDCGWREPYVRTHCGAKSKAVMIRKRGRM